MLAYGAVVESSATMTLITRFSETSGAAGDHQQKRLGEDHGRVPVIGSIWISAR